MRGVPVELPEELHAQLDGIGLLLMGIDVKLEKIIEFFDGGDEDEEEETDA